MSDWNTIQTLIVAIPALPLAATLLTAALGPRVLRRQSHWPTVMALAVSFVLSIWLVREVVYESGRRPAPDSSTQVGFAETVTLWTWASVPLEPDAGIGLSEGAEAVEPADPFVNFADEGPSFDVAVTLRADGLTAIMLAMVTFIATLVAIYSIGYMHGEAGYWRFFAYVSLFVFSMTMLVSVSNFLLLYVFWEAVGVCSYLLIGFWYQKPEAAAAGKKAFLVNRIGDFGFAIAIFLIWLTYGTLDFHDVGNFAGVLGETRLASPDTAYVGGGIGLAICLLLMLGACGKSAQFPLHVWLPDAMEGPTPVSALIHAATMVTAGVYMVTRCTPLFMIDASPYVDPQIVVAVIGGFTALLAGVIAMTQNDLKRVLAYSTISQLGYMFLSLGTGTMVGIVAGMFHLFTHAFFKALLFLGSGSVMHAMGGVIDMRRFGGLRKLLPVTHWTFLFGALALAGVPVWAGFFSKDAIVAAVYDQGHEELYYAPVYEWLAYAAFFTAFLTAMYTFRAFFMTFYGDLQTPPEAGHHAHESPSSMVGPLLILAASTVLVGWVFGASADPATGFARLLASTPSLAAEVDTNVQDLAAASSLEGSEVPHAPEEHGAHTLVATISVALAGAGILLAAFFYLGSTREAAALAKSRVLRPFYLLSKHKFFFDELYTAMVVWPGLALARLSDWLDRWLVDGLVNVVGRVPRTVGVVLRGMQSGLVQLYALLMVLGLATLLASVLWR
jgi:NADH-quinone oxidoreductase subunit L